jgi:hypothetical protein
MSTVKHTRIAAAIEARRICHSLSRRWQTIPFTTYNCAREVIHLAKLANRLRVSDEIEIGEL